MSSIITIGWLLRLYLNRLPTLLNWLLWRLWSLQYCCLRNWSPSCWYYWLCWIISHRILRLTIITRTRSNTIDSIRSNNIGQFKECILIWFRRTCIHIGSIIECLIDIILSNIPQLWNFQDITCHHIELLHCLRGISIKRLDGLKKIIHILAN